MSSIVKKLKPDASGFINGHFYDGSGKKGPTTVEIEETEIQKYAHLLEDAKEPKKEKA